MTNPAKPDQAKPDQDKAEINSANEGEGNRTAARQYNEATEKFAHSGKVEDSAKAARDALNSDEAADLALAEREGLKHSHGEDPKLKKK